MPNFMTFGSQMPQLDPRGFFAPPYKIGCQNTPYKLGLNGLDSLIIVSLPAEPVTLLYNPITLSLKVLNALLAPSLIGLGTWFINQEYHLLSLVLTCDRDLLISCRSNISISCGLGFLILLSSIGSKFELVEVVEEAWCRGLELRLHG